MGVIRLEPKEEETSKEDYRKLKDAIVDAWKTIDEHRVYWDLDEGERPNKVKRAFLEVAEAEDIPLRVRRIRGQRTLELSFDTASGGGERRSVNTRDRILEVLRGADEPMTRKGIVDATGISPSAWSKAIKGLVDEGKVVKLGHRRDSTYRLPG